MFFLIQRYSLLTNDHLYVYVIHSVQAQSTYVQAQSTYMQKNQCPRIVRGCMGFGNNYAKRVIADRKCNDCCRLAGCSRGDCRSALCKCSGCKYDYITDYKYKEKTDKICYKVFWLDTLLPQQCHWMVEQWTGLLVNIQLLNDIIPYSILWFSNLSWKSQYNKKNPYYSFLYCIINVLFHSLRSMGVSRDATVINLCHIVLLWFSFHHLPEYILSKINCYIIHKKER